MRYSRIAAIFLGAWLWGSFLLMYLAAEGFERALTVLTAPPTPLADTLQAIPSASQRAVLRYVVADQNRFFFEFWENAEFVIGVALIMLLFLGVESRLMSALTLGMVLVVAFQHLMITPELGYLSRTIEFIPGKVDSPPRDQFWKLHTLYITLDVLKIALGGLVSMLLITAQRKRRSRSSQSDAELIEKRLARAR
jgi:hypothetical protein